MTSTRKPYKTYTKVYVSNSQITTGCVKTILEN